MLEKKIQDEEARKLYKRAYKKYYARYMKGKMSAGEFKAWGTQAASGRGRAIEQIKAALDEARRAQTIKRLEEKLNRL